jgi:hypothetical protein
MARNQLAQALRLKPTTELVRHLGGLAAERKQIGEKTGRSRIKAEENETRPGLAWDAK